jgi:hypothetical protein
MSRCKSLTPSYGVGGGAGGAGAPILGGCTLGAVDGPLDPVLPGLVLLAVVWLWRRRRVN